jgi:DNA-binding NarL/FixJ family response regulator
MIDVLIVDDHPIFRSGLENALADLADVRPCGTAGTAEEAVTAAARLRPDVVLMDVDLGTGSGIDATARIVEEHPSVAVLMLTMIDADSTVFAAVCAGARGYLLKGADQAEIHRAVLAAAAGEAVFGAGVAQRVLDSFRARGEPRPDVDLTDRERQILDLMAEGWGNQDIADRLYLAPKTVRNNVSMILAKLQARSRGEAIVRARGWGFGAGSSTSG